MDRVRGIPCCVCGLPSDPAHIKSRGSGGDDSEENLLNLCRTHHRISHDLGWSRFLLGFPEVKEVLRKKGWELVKEFGIERLRRISDRQGV